MSPKFKTIDVRPQETLGQKLKKIREDLKFSLDEIEKRTKIRKKYIKAIEDGNFSELPSDVYAKGFLKNYAKLLGVSQGRVLEIYEKERDIINNIKEAKSKKNKVNSKKPKFILTSKTLIIFLVVISSVAVASYIVYEIFILNSPPRLQIISPKENESITTSFIDIIGSTDPGAEIFINSQKVNTSEDGDFKVTVSIGKNGINSVIILAKNPKNGKTTEITRNIIADVKEISVPEEIIVEQQQQSLQLEIGPKSAYVKVVKDGELVFEGLMLPETKKSFDAVNGFLVSTSNAGSTKFIFNGRTLGTLGEEGSPLIDYKFDKNTVIN